MTAQGSDTWHGRRRASKQTPQCTRSRQASLGSRPATPTLMRLWCSGYFRAPEAMACPLGDVPPGLTLPLVTCVFCSIDRYADMKVRHTQHSVASTAGSTAATQ